MPAYVTKLYFHNPEYGYDYLLVATDLEDLHKVAEPLKLRINQLMVSREGVPHYCLKEEMRAKALQLGAIDGVDCWDKILALIEGWKQSRRNYGV